MAASSSSSSIHVFLIILSILLVTPEQTASSPTALVLPVTKHPSTLLYTTQIQQRTPLVPLDVVLDLDTQFLWVSHEQGFNSSTFRQSTCNSSECSTAQDIKTILHRNNKDDNKTKCSEDICTVTAWSSAFKTTMVGNLSQDTISLPSIEGITHGDMMSTPFVFSATRSLVGFTQQGIAGLGRNQLAFPTQLAAKFKLSRKFAICLPPPSIYPHPPSKGVIFFGDGPYAFNPGIDVSKLLIYTPLIRNPESKITRPGSLNEDGDEYFIGMKSIEVNGKKVKLNSTLLARSEGGKGGGTKISTVNPYTQMESSIYRSFVKLFVKEARNSNLTWVRAVEPFEVCYSTKTSDGFRPAMPTIDLILQTKKVFWRVFETNSMVIVNGGEVACLGFLDAGVDMAGGASIVIGGHQLEDNLVQVDLEESRLGFTSTLLFRQTSCANFDFNPRD